MDRRQFLRRTLKGAGGVAALAVLTPFSRAFAALAEGPIRRMVPGMGTWIHLTAAPGEADEPTGAVEAALSEMARMERLMSVFQPDSDLGRVNRSSGGTVEVDAHTLTVAAASQAYAELSEGALDPTVLPLMRHWGFLEKTGRGRRARDLAPELEKVGFGQMIVADGRLGLRHVGAEIDFGGIAKGYAVDQGIGRLRQGGVTDALLEAGGDLYAAGRPSPGKRWRIGIRHPQYVNRFCATVDMMDEAVATSGGYERYLTVGDTRVPHLIDPRSGQPATEIISATIFAPTAMEADALSTATCIVGAKAAQDMVGRLPGVEGIWVGVDGRRWASEGLKGRLHWV